MMDPHLPGPEGAPGSSGDGPADPSWNPGDIMRLVRCATDGAAVGAALELGLFWVLDHGALDAEGVEGVLGIPAVRAGHWLRLLASLGFIEATPGGFVPSERCRSAVLGTHSRETWAMLALEAREGVMPLVDLPERLLVAASPERAAMRAAYVDRMVEDPGRARRFTRMLAELHEPLAEALAGCLDLRGTHRLMDLGGGSGVVSMALLRRWPDLVATVIDIEGVCRVGREMARRKGLDARLDFVALDIQADPLPLGFDAVLECDVGIYDMGLFARVHEALGSGGRFLIVDDLAPSEGFLDLARVRWAFQRSLADPGFVVSTIDTVVGCLRQARFELAGAPRTVDGTTMLIDAIAV